MELFASTIPDNFLKVFPRGILPDPDGGYSWHPKLPTGRWPELKDFDPAIASLANLLRSVQERHLAQAGGMIVIGFSQGAALGCAFTLAFPAQVRALAILSGFVPEIPSATRSQPILYEKPVFVAHGIEDRLVPLGLAERGILSLTQLGAKVDQCQATIGHKVSADCLRALRAWLANLPS